MLDNRPRHGSTSSTASLVAIVESSRSANLDDEHDPEGATVGFERAQVQALLDAARTRLVELEAAHGRVARGTYGLCDTCGAQISRARLDARPTAPIVRRLRGAPDHGTASRLGSALICTFSPQGYGDSSTPGPYPPRVTSLAPGARDGLVRSVVVIEDEQPIADAVAARLRSEGYAVEIAADGPSGVALCERIRPDLVVLDLMLPGLDGHRGLQADPTRPARARAHAHRPRQREPTCSSASRSAPTTT